MDETAYDFESATWYDIENNKMHLKKDGEHYVADAVLFRDNLNLRQENESLKGENTKLRNLLVDMAVHMHEWALDDSFAYDLWFGDGDAGLTGYAALLRELGIEVRDD